MWGIARFVCQHIEAVSEFLVAHFFKAPWMVTENKWTASAANELFLRFTSGGHGCEFASMCWLQSGLKHL